MAFHHALPSANFFALLAAFVSHSAMLVQSVEPMTKSHSCDAARRLPHPRWKMKFGGGDAHSHFL